MYSNLTDTIVLSSNTHYTRAKKKKKLKGYMKKRKEKKLKGTCFQVLILTQINRFCKQVSKNEKNIITQGLPLNNATEMQIKAKRKKGIKPFLLAQTGEGVWCHARSRVWIGPVSD